MKDRTSLANSGASHFSELIEQIQRVARPSRWTSSNDTRHMGMQRRMVRVRGDFDDRPVATFLGPSACLATNWKPLSWRLGQVAQEAEEAFHAG
ncbi:hypothetical protein CSUI_001217 [Cystoisospora suis]|uniref:Uncharacterized protein n=1 Tax=Cystoisospora suis TaxID=483139 RepID=A0A2C6LCG9_9APIC|nr:hypothetical protein CSUI_001217 [Cystoisospora suis]